jgi:ATP-dependent exoDNAse (exonuclease V) alpha subunit
MTSVVPFRLSMKKNIGRKSDKSVVASAAYIARERIKDRESGKIYDYRKGHSEVLFSKIFTPEIVPEWTHDRRELWNKVQETEFRKDAQYARSLEINLPYEFSHEHMVELIEDFVRDNFTSKGMIADVALHKPDDHAASHKNYHAHILLTLREVNADGFGYKVREWNHINQLRNWREDLALKCSKMFESHEYLKTNPWLPQRWLYSHLTLVQQCDKALERCDFEYAQACNHQPTKHKGVQIYHMEKRGIESYVEKNRNERASSKNIQETKSPEIEQPFYNSYEIQRFQEESKRLDEWLESMRQQREQEKADRAIDEELINELGHLVPELKKDEITSDVRDKYLKVLESYRQSIKEQELEHTLEKEHERERDR